MGKTPDLLSPEQIQRGLPTKVLGRLVHYFEEIASTQDESRKLAEKGAKEGTLVVAETQTSGRGRMRRQWVSPRGAGIYFSLILRPDLEPYKMAQMPIVIGISVRDTIAQVINIQMHTKWPNDILFEKKKVAGILTEMKAEPEKVHYLIVGVGINVNTPRSVLPKELRTTATSLSEASGHTVSRPTLIQHLLAGLEKAYARFKQDGFEPFRERWRQWDQTLNSLVVIENAEGTSVSGHARDVDKDGALIVEDAQGQIHRITVGDATVKRWA